MNTYLNPQLDCESQFKKPGCPITVNTKCVPYTGQALACIGVDTNDRLDVILSKINSVFCNVTLGSGSISNFSSGNLEPLFTTTVTTATTTPVLGFSLKTAVGNTVFGNFTNAVAVPTYNTATTDNRFLVRRTGALQFGPLLYTDIPLTFVNGITHTTGTVKLGGLLIEHTEINAVDLYNLTLSNCQFRVTGTYSLLGAGEDIVSYTQSQMFFNPQKAAFRAGQALTGQWNHANVGYYSFAFGANSTASDNYAACWGTSSFATGILSTAWGSNCTASHNSSTSWGGNNLSSEHSSTSFGRFCIAAGQYSLAHGYGVTTDSYIGTALGSYNDNTASLSAVSFEVLNRVFEIGIGTSDVSRANALTILYNGNHGVGVLTPTAKVHVTAGTAAAGTAPVKLTSGTNLTAVEAGALEFNGTNLFFSPSTIRNSVLMAEVADVVSPTSPDRTIAVNIGGTTYYIHAKTTND